ncbi:MAG: ERF family protein [Planctomycetota bacterium]
MNKSENIDQIATALVAAQSKLAGVKMNAVNPFLKNKYADLGAIIEAAREPLRDNGLSISQLPGSDNGSISLTTILMHKSGQWLESTIAMPIGDEKGRSLAQSAGSIITYLRRYSYAAIIGAYADEDADGNNGAGAGDDKKKSAPVVWFGRKDLVTRAAKEIPYLSGEAANAIKSLDYLTKHGTITFGMDDDTVFATLNKAASAWADKKAEKK